MRTERKDMEKEDATTLSSSLRPQFSVLRPSSSPTIAIIGSGAVGCYYGGRLAQHGLPVHFLLRASYDGIRQRGLVVKSLDGDFALPPDEVNAYRNPQQMPKADLVMVALKTTANGMFRSLVGPLLKEDTVILTIQNGLGNEETLAELFGRERIVGGLAFVCINRMADGSIHHLDHGQIKLAEFDRPPQPRTARIAELFNGSQVRCEVLDNLRYARWEKLVWNVPFNGLGAVLDKTTDLLIGTPEGEALVRSLMAEVIATAERLDLHYPADLADQKIANTRTMGAYRTSMQIDRQQGRPLEIDSILRRPLEIALSNNVAAPCLQTLYRMASLL
ncbi:MAG TPA: 2-dehydropantoate 2-reductase [Tepidisphaeraceae bacterium]|nr:2-dehydropantoate 2-reductase [Tepidisphaeraceae bacterium]